MAGDQYEVDLTEFTEEDKAFLGAVDKHSNLGLDELATTTDVRGETDLTRSQIHYRIDKFEERGLLNVERPDRQNGNAPKEFRLTHRGKESLDRGVFDDAVDPANTIAALADQVKTLRARVEAVEVNVETDSPYAFTERQRDAIRYYIEEDMSINRRTEERFWWDIFPTIAAELGYPRTWSAPAPDEYLDEFPYDMLDAKTKEPSGPDPDEPTLAERVDRLEEKIDALAGEIDGGPGVERTRADD